jgi:CheY-like chemotaxis protein
MPHALIIDDKQSNIHVLNMLLEQGGVTFVSASRADKIDEALQAGQTPDIVFLDLELDDATGIELLPQLRRHPQLVGAKFIAYTVHTSEITLAQEAGFDGFLGKPLDAVGFPRALRDILAGVPVWIA